MKYACWSLLCRVSWHIYDLDVFACMYKLYACVSEKLIKKVAALVSCVNVALHKTRIESKLIFFLSFKIYAFELMQHCLWCLSHQIMVSIIFYSCLDISAFSHSLMSLSLSLLLPTRLNNISLLSILEPSHTISHHPLPRIFMEDWTQCHQGAPELHVRQSWGAQLC